MSAAGRRGEVRIARAVSHELGNRMLAITQPALTIFQEGFEEEYREDEHYAATSEWCALVDSPGGE